MSGGEVDVAIGVLARGFRHVPDKTISSSNIYMTRADTNLQCNSVVVSNILLISFDTVTQDVL
jgi:hypothetical protein